MLGFVCVCVWIEVVEFQIYDVCSILIALSHQIKISVGFLYKPTLPMKSIETHIMLGFSNIINVVFIEFSK